MKRLRFLLFAVAGVPLLASAQAARVDAAAPQAGASATLPYQSAFAGYLPAPQSEVTPDKAWLQANSELAAAGGHAGHGMAAPSQAPRSATPHQGHQAAPSSARPSSDPHQGHAAPQPASPAADPHQGHHMQMKGQ
jgi:hypothetical protein